MKSFLFDENGEPYENLLVAHVLHVDNISSQKNIIQFF